MSETVSPALARRIALAAQGFGAPPAGGVGTRQLNLLLRRLGVLQIDSVNVFERSHYLPVFARLGGYDKALLDKLTLRPRARYLEYWAHEAAIIPAEDWPLLRWRMERYRASAHADPDSWSNANQPMLDWLRSELADKGPLVASEIEHDANVRQGPWWGWSDVKRGLETLFRWGEVVSAGRTRFQRTYALAEQVLPGELLDVRIDEADAVRELVRRSAVAHGIGTAADLADYYRIKKTPVNAAIHELEDAGELIKAAVPGWNRPAWLHAQARLPRRSPADALLSPFDPVVWFRDRALRLFDFHYRIEIYTPAHQRTYGYYVLPVLQDDRIVARVDLKSDRQAGLLRVQAAWRENGAPDDSAVRLAALLRRTAAWQGLPEVVVAERGDLAGALASALSACAGG